jgi:hypothetical protein
MTMANQLLHQEHYEEVFYQRELVLVFRLLVLGKYNAVGLFNDENDVTALSMVLQT